MDNLLLFSEIILMGACILFSILNIYTYRISGNKKVLIVTGIFVLLFFQAVLALASEFSSTFEFMKEPRSFMVIDVLVLLVIYGATIKS